MKIRTNDKIIVTTGKYKGVKSEVTRVYTKDNKALVKDVNVAIRHIKKQGDNEGGRVKVEKPIDVSKIMLICPNCNKPTRVGYAVKAKVKTRVCKKCKKTI
jgi:large subunit ribosomal protein L24